MITNFTIEFIQSNPGTIECVKYHLSSKSAEKKLFLGNFVFILHVVIV